MFLLLLVTSNSQWQITVYRIIRKTRIWADKTIFRSTFRFDPFILYSNQGWILIMFFDFFPCKSTIVIFMPGIPHGYDEKKLFRFEINTIYVCSTKSLDLKYHNHNK